MTNGVLCLKDCGVWCECSLGRGEVNYLGLNSYFVPLQGSSQQTGEESDASWTGCISRSLWIKQHLFLFFYFFSCFNPPVCLFDLCIWLKSQTHFIRAIGHRYLPMRRYRGGNGYFSGFFVYSLKRRITWLCYSQINYFTRQTITYRIHWRFFYIVIAFCKPAVICSHMINMHFTAIIVEDIPLLYF